MFTYKRVLVQNISREIERVAAQDAGDTEFAKTRRERIDREARPPPRAYGLFLSDLAPEFGERGVDFILDKRSAGRRRALGKAALVDEGNVETEEESTSAIRAPVISAPVTRTSASRSAESGPCVTAGPLRASHTDRPVRKFLAAVATSPPYLLGHGQYRNMVDVQAMVRRLWVSLARAEELEPRRDPSRNPSLPVPNCPATRPTRRAARSKRPRTAFSSPRAPLFRGLSTHTSGELCIHARTLVRAMVNFHSRSAFHWVNLLAGIEAPQELRSGSLVCFLRGGALPRQAFAAWGTNQRTIQ